MASASASSIVGSLSNLALSTAVASASLGGGGSHSSRAQPPSHLLHSTHSHHPHHHAHSTGTLGASAGLHPPSHAALASAGPTSHPSAVATDLLGPYDWQNEDNLCRWRGVFVSSLEKVLRQVHPQLVVDEEALIYLEDLILRLLAMLTSKPVPTSVHDIEDRVSKTFPSPIDKWAIAEAQAAIGKGKKKSSLLLPVDKVHPLLREVLHNRMEEPVTLYLVAVLEYISADILKLSGNYVKNYRHMEITRQDIQVAMCSDKVLMEMFQQENVLNQNHEKSRDHKKAQPYDEVVKDLIIDEKQYLRDQHMITKVFREILQKDSIGNQQEIDAIFSNIIEITELTVNLISSLEDTLEMTEEGNPPMVGPCFEELAEAEEFDVYIKYTKDILSPVCRQTLYNLLPKQSDALRTCGKGFREAIKFYLPELLLGPIHHCFHYFNYIEWLMKSTPSNDDHTTLMGVSSMLTPLKKKLNQAVQQAGPIAKRKTRSVTTRVSRQQAFQTLKRLQASIRDWDGEDLTNKSSCLVHEGKLRILRDLKKSRQDQRYVFLCDGIIIICKPCSNKRRATPVGSGTEYRLQEKHLISLVDVLDREDGPNEHEQFTFELTPRERPRIVFKAESEEEKNAWMAALVMLNTKPMLERLLNVILSKEETQHPLRFPPSDKYKFAEPDSTANLVLEEKEKSNGVPLIKGATLVKLVERLTYHLYADPTFLKTFLTTYRSFCTPHELLDLLIERFEIPEPEFASDSESDSEHGEKSTKLRINQDLKRFRKEYSQPVQFRVLNVLKHWVDQHFYDFEHDQELLEKLKEFLSTISGKSMRKWVDCIIKIVQRRSNDEKEKEITYFMKSPPPIERHLENLAEENGWPEILTYHPIEIARQLTLLEFQYYRAVKPSELVDQAWTREDKDKRSPNLLKMIRHTVNVSERDSEGKDCFLNEEWTTNHAFLQFTRYLQRLIVETENIDERVALVQRTLEIMVVLQEYNNFSGVLAITSVLNSCGVHRLSHTKDRVPNHLLKSLEEASLYIEEHFKLYWEKLRSINPPCVPFFGQYQSNILFLEEGNPDLLHNTDLINFSKRRKVAEIISEIQQYQNQPYCLETYPVLRTFLETLDPFPSMSDRESPDDYLWDRSNEIEPKNLDPAMKKKILEGKPRWKGLNLRSPGIKPKNLPGKSHPNPLPRLKQNHHRQSETDGSDSPLTSPIFRSSPPSGPSTPSAHQVRSPGDADPIKIPVMLPTSCTSTPGGALPALPPQSTGGSTSNSHLGGPLTSPGLPSHFTPSMAQSIPPPLPPKPPPKFQPPAVPPAVPNRSSSSGSPPPPPLPPRRDQHGIRDNGQWRDQRPLIQHSSQHPQPLTPKR
ncbi:hypothetical protein TCAL_01723 [Tigriopus californicus]|uniref:Protein son of sevenless n=1 Tax=Tigriopus californicus TaxID=6832 RepID=A0A553PML8_TIGCA|nr:hypothetical protein TCAL_01723 [Tigriopus californicus]